MHNRTNWESVSIKGKGLLYLRGQPYLVVTKYSTPSLEGPHGIYGS